MRIRKLNKDLGNYRSLLMKAVESAKRSVQAEMVICFGWTEIRKGHLFCNVLVLSGDGEQKPLKKQRASLKRHFESKDIVDGIRDFVEINWLLHSMAAVNRMIRLKHPFYGSIVRNGIVLYKNKGAALSMPRKTSVPATTGNDWLLHVTYGQQLQKLAELAGYFPYRLCAYYLYLALEQYGMAILKRYMGYKQKVPNVGKLFELLDLISPEFYKAFYWRQMDNGQPWDLADLTKAYVTISTAQDWPQSKYDSEKFLKGIATFRNIMMGLKDSNLTACDDVF